MVSTAVVESAGGLRADRVLGIDPGLTRCGYAIIEPGRAGHARPVAIGVIKTSPSQELAERLAVLQRDIASLLDEHRPAQVAVERIFFQVNVQTAMSVGQASGVIMALAANTGAQVTEYTPNQVKDAVAGWGGADKAQVQRMVQARLSMTTPPRPADAADAAAVALCHISTSPILQQLRSRSR